MSHLLAVPPELLIQIFAASDTILDALHLSATNRLLNEVWLEHQDPIIESILKPSLPAYDEAVELAFLETRLKYSMDDPPMPSLGNCLPMLLRNADLCVSVCLAYSLVYKDTAPPAVSYYFLRRISLGFIHYQLGDDLYLELRAMSKQALEIPRNLFKWLDGPSSWEEKVRQGVRENWQRNHADINGEWETPWDYAGYVLSGAIDDMKQGTDNLSIMVEGYDLWGEYPYFEQTVNPKIML
ncbi:hypothetical protein Q7P35_004561 [Cladosporium inversicolor]